MNDEEKIDPSHGSTRDILRIVGPIIALIGLGFTITGVASFFSAFNSFGNGPGAGFPDKFWCAFVGLPLLGLGIAISKFAYMGAVVRYVAGEIAPPAADTLNYLAEESKDGVTSLTEAISRGLGRGSQPGETSVTCPKCGEPNEADARFCKGCGAELAQKCPSCGEVNDADAKFCNKCGGALSSDHD